MNKKLVIVLATLAIAFFVTVLPALAGDNSISIAPVSGHWNYPGSFLVTNKSYSEVSIHWYLDCWDETICSDTEGEISLKAGSEGQSGESFVKGLGNICSKWQLDLEWNGGSWGGIAEKNPDCDQPTVEPTITATPTATGTITPDPTVEPTITVSPTKTATLPPVTNVPPADQLIPCVTPNTLGLADGIYDFYGPNVEVKTEDAFGSRVWIMLTTDQFTENGIHEVQNNLFRFSLKVLKDLATGQIYGYECALIQVESVDPIEPTAVPFAVDCDNVMEGAVTCDQEITWRVLAYVVNNPDPGITITGITLEQVVAAWITVNGVRVTTVDMWANDLFDNMVSGRWIYSDIQLGDVVKIEVRLNGLPLSIDVPVVEGSAAGNPAIPAMIGKRDELIVYPGNTPADVREITGFTGSDEELYDIWWNAHLVAQTGGSYTMSSEEMSQMTLFAES